MSHLTRSLLLDSPSGIKLQDLVVYKQFLRKKDGTSFTVIQNSDFNLLNLFDQGINIDPILADREDSNFLRVWTLYDIPLIGTMLKCPYDRIPSFLSKCTQFGKYVEFTAYTGINDPDHFDKLCTVAKFVEYVNELDQNLHEPDYLGRYMDCEVDPDGILNPFIVAGGQNIYPKRPTGILASHGSNGSGHWPVFPLWDYATFHTNGADEWWRKNGHNAMEIWSGPTITNESTRCPDNDSNPKRYYDAAAGGSLLCAGTCFHSVSGKVSGLFDSIEKNCFQNHVAGAKSVNLICQEGDYSHRPDLEGPDDLRVYQRGSEIVYIHKNP